MVYLDTGCLVKLYYPEEDSEVVASKTAGLPIVFTPLHDLELRIHAKITVAFSVSPCQAWLDA
jgi:hypothetical protein